MSPINSSEYEGGGVMPNTVFPKGTDALSNSDKLRLQSITGQETDSKAPVNYGFWLGNDDFDPNAPHHTNKEAERKEREMMRENELRYRETKKSF